MVFRLTLYLCLLLFPQLNIAQEVLWSQLEGNSPYGGDGYFVETDVSNNVYVCSAWTYPGWWDHGTSVIKYSPDGELQWISSYVIDTASFQNFVVNDHGQSFMVFSQYYGSTFSSIVAIDSNGVQLYNLELNNIRLFYIACDNDGNAFVTGYQENGFNDYDGVIIKYNINGEEEWMQFFPDPTENSHGKHIIVLDSVLYVAGNSWSYNLALKYNQEGTLLTSDFFFEDIWPVRRSIVIKYDNDGNLYTFGVNEYAEGMIKQGFIYKFDQDLNEFWHDTTTLFDQLLYDASFDENQNIVLCGWESEIHCPVYLKYKNDGEKLWHHHLEEGSGYFRRVVTKADRNYFIGSISYPDSTASEMILYSTNQQGEFVNQVFYPAPTGAKSYGRDLVLDQNDNLVTTGSFEDNSEYCLTIKYDIVTGEFSQLKNYNPSISIYPNPATNQTSISFDHFEDTEADVILYNSSGFPVQHIKSVRIGCGQNSFQINLIDLSPGLYFINISGRNLNLISKILISN